MEQFPNPNAGFIEYAKNRQPALLASLKHAEEIGLIIIDPETDAVTATNRLLLTYPGLHETLSVIINQWNEEIFDSSHTFKALIHNSKPS